MGVRVVTNMWDDTTNAHHEKEHLYGSADSWNLQDEEGYVEVVADSSTDDARVVAVLRNWTRIETVEEDDE